MNANFVVLTQLEWERLSKGVFKALLPLVKDDFYIQVGKDPEDNSVFIALPVAPLQQLIKLGVRNKIHAKNDEERQFFAMILQTPAESATASKARGCNKK